MRRSKVGYRWLTTRTSMVAPPREHMTGISGMTRSPRIVTR